MAIYKSSNTMPFWGHTCTLHYAQ